MKRALIICLLLSPVLSFVGQGNSNGNGGAKWSISGNSGIGLNNYLGTNDNNPLNLKTDGQSRISISSSGEITFHNLTSNNGSIMLVDANGNVQITELTNGQTDYLSGDGSFKSASTVTGWSLGNGLIQTNYNVGIGTNSANERLVVDGNILATGTVSASEINVVEFIKSDKGFKVNSTLCIEGTANGGTNSICSEDGPLYINNKANFNYHTVMNCYNNGNVGIGVCLPERKLHVVGNALVEGNTEIQGELKVGDNSLYLGSTTTGTAGVNNYIYSDNGSLMINSNEGQATLESTAINPHGGKVYIGIDPESSDPSDLNFHDGTNLYATNILGNLLIAGKNGLIGWRADTDTYTSPNTNGDFGMCIEKRDNGDAAFCSSGTPGPIWGMNFFLPHPHSSGAGGNWKMFISSHPDNAGNVGIGTPYPEYKLTVDGTIGAREVIVETDPWCDYVFEEDYDLMSIEDLENYLIKNKHLPEIPSAETIDSEGLPVGEIINLQMKKIEELTLYIIELNKEIESLKK